MLGFIVASLLMHTTVFYAGGFSAGSNSNVKTGSGSIEIEIVVLGGNGNENSENEAMSDSSTSEFMMKRKSDPFPPQPVLRDSLLSSDDSIDDYFLNENFKSGRKSPSVALVIPLPVQQGSTNEQSRSEAFNPTPKYPRTAILRGWEGETVASLNIDREGVVSSVQIIQSSGHEILDEAVAGTLKTWKFEKGAVRMQEIPVRFVLKQER